jgi:methionine-rich copper-binding protein CopC
VLSFSEAARLTALTLQREGAEARKLAPPATAAARFTIPVPDLVSGSYTLTWRAVGSDGHVTSGAVHFKVLESPATDTSGGRHRGP